MSFFKNLGAELGTATGKGIVGLFAGIGVVLWKITLWLLNWQHQGKIPEPRTNSYRIAAWSIILSIIFIPGLVTCTGKEKKWQENKNTVHVTVQLNEGQEPIMPPDESFDSLPNSNIQYYYLLENKKYFLFSEASKPGKIPSILINEPSCVLVRAGRELKIFTANKPLHAINMEKTLLRPIKKEHATYISRFYVFIQEIKAKESLMIISEDGWKQTFNSWQNSVTIKEDLTFILVKAKHRNDNPDNSAGGLVCF